MGAFLSHPLVEAVLVLVILGLSAVFVFRYWGQRGKGTGGVTGRPAEPQDPLANMKPSKPQDPRKPPKEQV